MGGGTSKRRRMRRAEGPEVQRKRHEHENVRAWGGNNYPPAPPGSPPLTLALPPPPDSPPPPPPDSPPPPPPDPPPPDPSPPPDPPPPPPRRRVYAPPPNDGDFGFSDDGLGGEQEEREPSPAELRRWEEELRRRAGELMRCEQLRQRVEHRAVRRSQQARRYYTEVREEKEELSNKVRNHQYIVGHIRQDVVTIDSKVNGIASSFARAGARADYVLGAAADAVQHAIAFKDLSQKDAALREAAAALAGGRRDVNDQMSQFERRVGPLAKAAADASMRVQANAYSMCVHKKNSDAYLGGVFDGI